MPKERKVKFVCDVKKYAGASSTYKCYNFDDVIHFLRHVLKNEEPGVSILVWKAK